MKLLLLAPICLLLACSSPRYLYRFPEPEGVATTTRPVTAKEFDAPVLQSPTILAEPPTVYSADVAAPAPAPSHRIRSASQNVVAKQFHSPMKKAPPANETIDGDLKRAIIFAVAGGVVLLIGGQVFTVAGSLSLLIGLIFGIKWFIRR